ncbi:MAG: hypothetical protein J6Z02_01680 [Lachnospiraceae bacterium]|nr:hypothetical protein [Lachnospiraceae bacterium]
MNRKILSLFVAACLSALFLSGCGKTEIADLDVFSVSERSVYLKADGSLQVAYVEDFSENYYDKNSLKEYALAVADEYNEENTYGDALIGGVSVKDNKAVLIMNFASVKAYAGFAGAYETDPVIEVFDEGEAHMAYDDESFMPVKRSKKSKKGSEAITGGVNVASISGQAEVQTSGKILYYTDGELIDDNHIKVFDGADAVIIYKK